MKIAKIILIFIFMGVLGCGQKTPKDSLQSVRFAFWGSPEEVQIITQAIRGWQKKNPGIDVVLEHTPYGGYASKILTRIAGGDAPDIIAAEVGLFTNFWAKGVFLELSSLIKQDENFSIDRFFGPIASHFTVDDKVYGIPRDVAPFACVYYNKNIFDDNNIPYPNDDWNWDDLLDIARQLTLRDARGRVQRYGFYSWAWQNFVLSSGGSLVDDVKNPTKINLDSQESREGLQFYA
ncbi:MAG: extracellular solute-binding protein, partial [Candidatus Omnitrophica bacterium]|nr:extracellular solute-binding protein [Candidatus Omnitrophota bacterium]